MGQGPGKVRLPFVYLKNIRAVYSHTSCDINKEKQLCKLKKRVSSTGHKKQKRLCCTQLALSLAIFLTLVPVIFLLWTSRFRIQVIIVFAIMYYRQVYIHPIIETSLISDIRIPLRDMLTCGYFKKKPKDGFVNNQWKFFKGFDSGCIKEGGKCFFFITALQAAILPRDNSCSNCNEQQP